MSEARVLEIEGSHYFVGSDVAKELGYADPKGAVSKHCRHPIKRRITDNRGVSHVYVCIPEGDMYRLAVKSQLPGAEKFEAWIFDEILPSIRKTGGYMANEIQNYLRKIPNLN